MVKRSSGEFVWIGKGRAPCEGLTVLSDLGSSSVSAALVSGELDPREAYGKVRESCGSEVPWVVFGITDDFTSWLKEGASAFLPACSPPELLLTTLEGVSKLTRTAITRNPLSGLPGNAAIASAIRTGVLNGDCCAAYFDISGFKPFNDYYGFSRGDAVLRSLASILSENLSEHFVGHIGGDDFVAVGHGEEFIESVRNATRIFNGRAGGFYSAKDHSAGGIEALDRTGEFRFYPIMDLTVSVVDGSDCGDLDQLARKAGLEKKRLKGEIMPDTVAGFLAVENESPGLDHLRRWIDHAHPETVETKALLESAGILGDTAMIRCLSEVLEHEGDYRIRKSAARSLGNIALRESADTLKKACNDENIHVRTAATNALPFVLGGEAGPLLKTALNDSSTWVRRAALRGLGVSGWEGASGLLRSELQRDNEGRYWLNHRQELTAALEGAAFLGDSSLAEPVIGVLRENPGVSKNTIWKTLLTLGGSLCLEEMLRAFREDDYHECIENLSSLDPGGFSPEQAEELESVLISLNLRRRDDRVQVLGLLSQLDGKPGPEVSRWLLSQTSTTEDSYEFEVLLNTLIARGISPGEEHFSEIMERISSDKLRLSRKATVSLLRWVSTGHCTISRPFLERMLRHDSREVRTAAARAVIAIARRQKPGSGVTSGHLQNQE